MPQAQNAETWTKTGSVTFDFEAALWWEFFGFAFLEIYVIPKRPSPRSIYDFHGFHKQVLVVPKSLTLCPKPLLLRLGNAPAVLPATSLPLTVTPVIWSRQEEVVRGILKSSERKPCSFRVTFYFHPFSNAHCLIVANLVFLVLVKQIQRT